MNGPEHYREAEALLRSAAGENDELAQQERLAALVHATLALAAATAGGTLGQHGVPSTEWQEALR